MADITFAKKTTLDSLNSDISSYLSSTKYRIDVSKSVIDSSGYSISYQLFQNMKIICDKSILTPISSNLSEITDGYEVTSTGLVQLQSSEPISETNRPLLTILS